ncbi:Transposase [Levilactobacillus brevis]|nr:Transposase [Levilactobacillus brevis]
MNELTTEIIAALAQKQDLDEVFRTTSKLRLTSCFKPNWQ